MATELKVPALPESVSDGVLVCWHKQPGEAIRRDEPLVDIETDKVVLEVPAPQDGVLEKILVADGSTVEADQVIGVISASGSISQVAAVAEEDVVELKAAVGANNVPSPGPAARRLLAEHDIDPRHLTGSGRSGRITKADVLAGVAQSQAAAPAAPAPPAPQPVSKFVTPE
ncbi:MAG: biotin/lipoyl-containing protein, partial [Gammaproteobacteria bacterium]